VTTAEPGRRRLDASASPTYEVVTRNPRVNSPGWSKRLIRGTFVAWLVSTLVAATAIVDVGAPSWLWRPAAAALLVCFSLILTHRVGGHMRIWVTLTSVLAILAWLTGMNTLLAGAAGATAVLSAVTAVLFTEPAPTALKALREYAVLLALSISGAIGVAAWNANVNPRMFGLVAMLVAVVFAVATVWSLGSGLHGLNKHHLKPLAVVALVAVALFFYGSFLRTSGSATLTTFLDESIVWMRQSIVGVPRPYEFLIGFPALIVGTSLRSRYREGWWICVLAVVGSVIVTVSLVNPAAYPSYFALSTLYSAILGLVIGLVIRAVLMRPRGRRSARAVQLPKRVEPKRLAPLK